MSASHPANVALWFVESHYASDLSLDQIAEVACVSKHHLVRAFGASYRCSLMRYLRRRRLSEAARRLADGAASILPVAIDAGYASHEAFTRAFVGEFGLTPEAVRQSGNVEQLPLTSALRLDERPIGGVQVARAERAGPLLVAGLRRRYNLESSSGIPAQWQEFRSAGASPAGSCSSSFGVRCNFDDEGSFEYITGIEVDSFSDIPGRFVGVRLAEQEYLVFLHTRHVAEIRRTWSAILNEWLPQSGYRLADAPDFERYGDRFDPETGRGGFEIWIPVLMPGRHRPRQFGGRFSRNADTPSA